jgi:hypothetical protein
MEDFHRLAENYISVWNEKDDDSRRKRIEELWTENGEYVFPQAILKGHEAILAGVTDAFGHYGAKGLKFRLRENASPDANHHSVRFGWELVNPENGKVTMAGVDFVIVDDTGRIISDHQFFDVVPV